MNRSLKSRLTVWLAVIVGAIALATGGYSYVKAFDDAAELQDDQLRQMAALIDHYETPVAAIDAAPCTMSTPTSACRCRSSAHPCRLG